MIHSQFAVRVKPNATYLTVPRSATKGFKKNRNSHHEIIKKIVTDTSLYESMSEFISSKGTRVS